jgi:hypothetical protein
VGRGLENLGETESPSHVANGAPAALGNHCSQNRVRAVIATPPLHAFTQGGLCVPQDLLQRPSMSPHHISPESSSETCTTPLHPSPLCPAACGAGHTSQAPDRDSLRQSLGRRSPLVPWGTELNPNQERGPEKEATTSLPVAQGC